MLETRRILAAHARTVAAGRGCALATVTWVEGSSYRRVGARMLVDDAGAWVGCVSGGCLERDLLRRAAWALERGEPRLVTYDTRDDHDGRPGAGLGCNGVIEILLEPIPPGARHPVLERIGACLAQRRSGGAILRPRHPSEPPLLWDGSALPPQAPGGLEAAWTAALRGRARAAGVAPAADGERIYLEALLPPLQVVVIGAGHDAVAMAALGVHLGHEVRVVDLRSAAPLPEGAFPGVAGVVRCRPDELPARIALDRRSAVVVMTHNAADDGAVLPWILASAPAYVGLLGPRTRTAKVLAGCGLEAAIGDGRLHGPIGLDIGAESPEEIALAVYGEIQAVLAGRGGGQLRRRDGPIHARATASCSA